MKFSKTSEELLRNYQLKTGMPEGIHQPLTQESPSWPQGGTGDSPPTKMCCPQITLSEGDSKVNQCSLLYTSQPPYPNPLLLRTARKVAFAREILTTN